MINTNHRIEFDPEKCVGCQICYKSCFVDVIRWDAEAKKPVFKYVEDCEFVDVIRWDAEAKKPVFKYVEDCEHCFLCMALCKKEAITVIPNYESEHMLQSFEKYA